MKIYFSPLTPIEQTGASQGVVSYFSLIKIIAAVLGVASIASIALCVMYMLFSSFLGGFTNFIIQTSIGSIAIGHWQRRQNIMLFNLLLVPEIALLVIIHVGIQFLKNYVKKAAKKTEKEIISCADFSLMVQGLPKEEKQAKNIFEHFDLLAPVHSVLLCFECSDHVKIQKKLDETVEYYLKEVMPENWSLDDFCHFTNYYPSPNERYIEFEHQDEEEQDPSKQEDKNIKEKLKDETSKEEKQIKSQEEEIKSLRKEIKELYNKKYILDNPVEEETTGTAFVIFNKMADAQKVAEFKYQGQYPLHITQNVEPNDVKFDNLRYSLFERNVRSFVGNYGTAIFTIASGTIIPWFMNKLKTLQNVVWLSLIISEFISFLEGILPIIQKWLRNLMKPITMTEEINSLVSANWIAEFAMGTFMQYAASLISSEKVLFDEKLPETSTRYFMSYTWFFKVAYNMLSNVFMDAVNNYVNKQYEPPQIRFDEKLSQFLQILFTGVLVAPFMPLMVPVIAAYFGIIFITDKYYKAPLQYSKELINSTVNHLEVAFHFHFIVAILSFFFIVFTNIPSNERNFRYYLNGIVLSGIILQFFLHKQRKNIKVEDSAEKAPDKTQDLPFSFYEKQINNYLDKHPVYNESEVHELTKKEFKMKYKKRNQKLSLPKLGDVKMPSVPSIGKIQKPNIPSFSDIQKPNVPSISDIQMPSVPSIGKIQKPNIPSFSDIQKPNVPSIGDIQMPSVPSIGKIQKPNIPSFSDIQKPTIPKINEMQMPSITKIGDLQKPTLPSIGDIQNLNVPSIGDLQQPNMPQIGNLQV
ncbi:MAG: hypothetical protein EZS28_021976 [Streblomastix strix]|uniref:CSC1/OSCA1-like cytosolic domain-containing protein n=1 Tax=Streblomastix strix TaxID=222440 RepID=A0A5J4VIM8_9EUKA|nr:MAG: hypothetical protein EZS28_021976 [Streblomastix strix]